MSGVDEVTVDGRTARRWTGRVGLALGGVLLAAVALALLVVAARSHGGPVHRFDIRFDDRINNYAHRHPGQVTAWRVVTDVGGPATWRVLAGVVAIVLWVRRQRRLAVLLAVAMAGAAVLSGVIKTVVARSRPLVPHPVAHAGGGSFPSGHALTSFTALALLVLLAGPRLSRRWRVVLTAGAALAALAVGFSRLMLGVHYLTDVLGGWLIGALWVAAASAAIGTVTAAGWSHRRGRRR